MSDFIQTVKGTALSVAEFFTPVLKESKFKKTGVLTPEEFVIAGDHLVHQCPTWKWCSVDNPSHLKSYLPPNKQYLVTKSVPCYKRCKDIEYTNCDEKLILTENDTEGWVDTHHSDPVVEAKEMIGELSLNDEKVENKPINETSIDDDDADEDDDEEAEDMENFLNMVDDDDDASTALPKQPSTSGSKKLEESCEHEEKNNLVPTRTYDLNITYDKYYQTPRLWLIGYDEHSKPLTIEQMYEDISQDHAKKTVTMESHPNLGTVMASVHPCRHAEVMKKIISTVEEGGNELQIYSYLIIFLKLVQSVIPTIEYDFTQNFTM